MATTTNYGWTTPDDTALVKDGASAIRSLGTSVDTTTKALNPSTTLGDIEYRSSTANTNTRLGIGSTGNVLTVAGGVPTWAAPASAGGMTLISTTTLSGSSTSITIPTGYKDIYVLAYGITWNTANSFVGIGINGSNTLTYQTGVFANAGNQGAVFNEPGERLFLAGSNQGDSLRTSSANSWSFNIFDYLQTDTYKSFRGTGSWLDTSSVIRESNWQGQWRSTSAITSLLFSTGQSGLAGTVKLWGVN